MGQGQINVAPQLKSPVEGIMAALQAVHSYYGIDTEKAQQKLLGVQTEKAQTEADVAARDAADQAHFQQTNEMSPLMAFKSGLPVVKVAGKAADAGAAAAPMQQQALANGPQGAAAGVAAGEAAGTGASPLALNDTVASDASSPMLGSVRKISEVATPQGKVVKANIATQPSGIPTYAVAKVAMPDGSTAYAVDPKLEQQALANAKTRVETAKAGEELKELPQKQKTEAIKDFDRDATPYKTAIAAANTIQKGLLSGNKISENLGQIKTALEVLGVKRAGEGIIDSTAAPDLMSKINDYVEKTSTGYSSPDEIDGLNKALNVYKASAADNLSKVASEHGARAESILGIPADKAVSKLFLPKGMSADQIPTSVGLNDSGERVLMRLDKRDANGKPQEVMHDQQGPKWSGTEKAAIAAGSLMGGFVKRITGAAGKLLSSEEK